MHTSCLFYVQPLRRPSIGIQESIYAFLGYSLPSSGAFLFFGLPLDDDDIDRFGDAFNSSFGV